MSGSGILYGYVHIDAAKRKEQGLPFKYLGYHKTDNVDDGYTFSSEDPDLLNEWSYGRLERVVVIDETQNKENGASICITAENCALKKIKKTPDWKNYWNQSVGGGEGCVRDFSNLSELHKKQIEDFINGVRPEPEKQKTYPTKNWNLVADIKSKIKSGFYKKIKQPVRIIVELPRNQVRSQIIIQTKVDEISAWMKANPEISREEIEPVIIIVFDDGTEMVGDGNHTINAAHQSKWQEVDCIFINFSDFDNNMDNVNAFGYQMNEVRKIKTGNQPEDCQQAIVIKFFYLKENGYPDVDIRSEMFKQTVLSELCLEGGGCWTRKQIVKNLKSAIDRYETELANAKHNFQLYEDIEKTAIVREIEKVPNTYAIAITASTCYNAGVGAILSAIALRHNSDELATGVIVINFTKLSDYENRGYFLDRMKKTLLFADKSKCDIQWRILNPFDKNKYEQENFDSLPTRTYEKNALEIQFDDE